MKLPKISIVTPSFNSVKYIEQTILSVIEQNYENLEYIIIDGGSTDGTLDIIKKYENKLAYWISEKDNGMYEAIQKGFDKSTGEIMAWIGSDDMYHKRSLFCIAEIFSKFKEVKWLLGAMTTFDEHGRAVEVQNSRNFTRFDFLNGDYKWLQQESCFWHRSLWEKAGANLNLSLKFAGDFELWIRFFRYEKLYVTSALIGGFRARSSNQLSRDHYEDYIDEVENVINNEKISLNKLKEFKRYKRAKKIQSQIEKISSFLYKRILNNSNQKEILFARNKQEFYCSNKI